MNLAAKKISSKRPGPRNPTKMSRLKGPHLFVAAAEKIEDDTLLGQYIPLHYHFQMLSQETRMNGFERAIDVSVHEGMKVVELGGGTGVLSFFAARAGAAKVYCVERQPHVARAATRFLAANKVSDRVEVITDDAMQYLPPEPVNVVICEMLHAAMLREKQLHIIDSFKQRYLAKFGGPLPLFLPEATVMAVQPLYTDYDFHGYHAAVPMFLDGSGNDTRLSELGHPILYSSFMYGDDYTKHFQFDQELVMMSGGMLNSFRFVTRNLLAIVEKEGRSIDWDMQQLIIPLNTPLEVLPGDRVRVRFRYDAGDSILALVESMDAAKLEFGE